MPCHGVACRQLGALHYSFEAFCGFAQPFVPRAAELSTPAQQAVSSRTLVQDGRAPRWFRGIHSHVNRRPNVKVQTGRTASSASRAAAGPCRESEACCREPLAQTWCPIESGEAIREAGSAALMRAGCSVRNKLHPADASTVLWSEKSEARADASMLGSQ